MTFHIKSVVRLEQEDGTPVEWPTVLTITPEMDAAIHEYVEALHVYVPGLDSMHGVESPMMDLGREVLRSLGFAMPPRVADFLRPAEVITGPPYKRRSISTMRRLKIMLRDGGRCVECESVKELSIDHIVPVSKGGSDEDDNLQTLCRRCNSSKRDRISE